MTISASELTATGVGVVVSDESLTLTLSDGRTLSAPLAWYPRLTRASAEERGVWRLIGGGRGVHWPKLDEDVSVLSILAGQGSLESQQSLARWLAGRAN